MYEQTNFKDYELEEVHKIEVIDWPYIGDHACIVGSLVKIINLRGDEANSTLVFKIFLIANNNRYKVGDEYVIDIDYRKHAKHFTTRVTKL